MPSTLKKLEKTIHDRKINPKEKSYTSKLFAKGRAKIAQKVGEESTEVIIAALAEEREEQLNELADLFYHTLVLMAELDITLEDVQEQLKKRER